MLREISSVFSFLTIIPTSNANLETIAKYMYLFPIVGIVIGLLVGGFAYGLSFVGLEPLIVGLLVMASIAIITGIQIHVLCNRFKICITCWNNCQK